MVNLTLNDVKCWLLINVVSAVGNHGIFGLVVFLVFVCTDSAGYGHYRTQTFTKRNSYHRKGTEMLDGTKMLDLTGIGIL